MWEEKYSLRGACAKKRDNMVRYFQSVLTIESSGGGVSRIFTERGHDCRTHVSIVVDGGEPCTRKWGSPTLHTPVVIQLHHFHLATAKNFKWQSVSNQQF